MLHDVIHDAQRCKNEKNECGALDVSVTQEKKAVITLNISEDDKS